MALALVWHRSLGAVLLTLVAAALIAAVFAAVHHAEVVAQRVGEPYGTLILALAITIIELALIVSIMLSGAPGASALARDTLFATVMIVCNGVVGLCLLAGSLRHHVLEFRVEGTSPALSVLVALTALTLVLPSLTLTTPGPEYSTAQLVFAGVMSLALYSVMVFVQTVRHRDYFLPVGAAGDEHAPPPRARQSLVSLVMLVLSLIAVVGLAKILSPGIRASVDALSAPPAVVGIVIALLVLLPETTAALRAALRNRMQTSLNLALGSALASIGLTIPAVAGVAISIGLPLALGLDAKETALLAVTLLISTTTLATGRATVLQ
ncbi:MAG TPA: ionic transporter y4hA, partial [Burkholderiales bacterium]|nr:ionic transporter y4hA [Burkholderiales bacterium]